MKFFRRVCTALIVASLTIGLVACSNSGSSKPMVNPADSAVVGTEENPVPFGEWGEVPFYNSYVTEYLKVYIRLTGVYRQGSEMYEQILQEAEEYINAGEATNVTPFGVEEINNALEYPGLEGVIVQYEAYIPEMKTLEAGLPAPAVPLEPYAAEGVPVNDGEDIYTLHGYVQLPSADYKDGQKFFPENTYTFNIFHPTVKGFSDYTLCYKHLDIMTSQDLDPNTDYTPYYFSLK